MKKQTKVKIALPDGSLREATLDILKSAGLNISRKERAYTLTVENNEAFECMLVKPQEAGRFVERGLFDAGVTGMDWVTETRSRVKTLAEFPYSKSSMKPTKLVLAVPASSPVKELRDLKGKIIATEFVAITEAYLRKNGVAAIVEFSWGATESKALYFSDAIVDIVDTGNSLAANGLRPFATVFESNVGLVANELALADIGKATAIGEFISLLKVGYENTLSSRA